VIRIERFLFLIGGLMLLQASIEDWIDKIFPWISIRIIIALFLIYYSLFGLQQPNGHKLKNIYADLKKRIGL